MSFWNRRLDQGSNEIDSFSDIPFGERIKMWLVCVGVALPPVLYGFKCIAEGEATLLGKGGAHLELSGNAGFALSIAYIAVGCFIHFHWFWGLHPRLQLYSVFPKILSLMAFIPTFGYALYSVFTRFAG